MRYSPFSKSISFVIAILMAYSFHHPIAFGHHDKTMANQADLIGTWDITLDMNGKPAPSWLEVKLSGIRTLVGHFVGNDGSARPISKVTFDNGKFGFSIPPQWQMANNDLVLEGELVDGKIKGTITYPDQKKYSFVGERAPRLVRDKAPKWGKSIALFNGKDLAGWHADKTQNQWTVKDGVLSSPKSGANLISDAKFEDFKLIVEFRYPEGSNSGIYLRGRYEVQIEDSKTDYPSSVYFGGIYGFLTPNEMVKKSPGEWQKFEITLIGRRVTIVANGKTIICDQIIPGITGGALDSQEGLPGPIMIQGDHGPVQFRKIELIPGTY
ncbi:3-keto-disaccharide hydrolase [Mariniradius sediminis]|uniref:DUF1080 domain-containing protein n=1 Tax=Mariniradius sediminis TaxID=2909237 RepID=A0ABS9BPP8_9BACT|nr:DUF1080 domain-containing protein [Mariniradius sediminis]MCF1750018.1 DUF1080 domain-containing protein [Mariniradius sediminis]